MNNPAHRHTLLKKILLWAVALACLPFIYISSRNILAGIYDFKARSHVETWEFQTQEAAVQGIHFTPSHADIQNAERLARAANSLSPGNPDFLTTLGDTLFWSLKDSPNNNTRIRQMLDTYRLAIHMRPYWPDGYLRLARAKALTGSFDAELTNSMKMTRRFGPWKPNTTYELIELGLWSWPNLDQETQNIIISAIEESQNWQIDKRMSTRISVLIWNLVVAYDRKATVCPRLRTDNPRVRQFCAPLTKAPEPTKAQM